MTSEWLCEQRTPPGNDGPVTTGTKGVMSKRRKRERRGKSQERKTERLKGCRVTKEQSEVLGRKRERETGKKWG